MFFLLLFEPRWESPPKFSFISTIYKIWHLLSSIWNDCQIVHMMETFLYGNITILIQKSVKKVFFTALLIYYCFIIFLDCIIECVGRDFYDIALLHCISCKIIDGKYT